MSFARLNPRRRGREEFIIYKKTIGSSGRFFCINAPDKILFFFVKNSES